MVKKKRNIIKNTPVINNLASHYNLATANIFQKGERAIDQYIDQFFMYCPKLVRVVVTGERGEDGKQFRVEPKFYFEGAYWLCGELIGERSHDDEYVDNLFEDVDDVCMEASSKLEDTHVVFELAYGEGMLVKERGKPSKFTL